MEIVAALRVKNESKWIGEVLDSIKWCKTIYLFDDHSIDDTREIAKEHGAIVLESPFEGFDEARDKEWLINQVASNHSLLTWVLMIDGDEVLEAGAEVNIKRMIEGSPGALAFSFHILYLWNSRKFIRIDGIYGNYARPRLFKLMGKYSFKRSGINGNLHCYCIPMACRIGLRSSKVSLLHLGYMNKEDRIRKWKFYNQLDPVNRAEGYDPQYPERGSYPHIVQGDIPEVPADIKLKHAGPLELKTI